MNQQKKLLPVIPEPEGLSLTLPPIQAPDIQEQGQTYHCMCGKTMLMSDQAEWCPGAVMSYAMGMGEVK